MLFGEKYGDSVRVLTIGSSMELCGGTHVCRTGDIGMFKILSQSGVAAGVRRIEAVTGAAVMAYLRDAEATRDQAAAEFSHKKQTLEREIARLKSKLATSQVESLVAQAVHIKGIQVLAVELEGADGAGLREALDKLKDKLKSAVIVLATVQEGKVSLIAGVTADLTSKIKAGELVNIVAQQVGGKGGGRADMAQAGGTQPEHLSTALAAVNSWIAERL